MSSADVSYMPSAVENSVIDAFLPNDHPHLRKNFQVLLDHVAEIFAQFLFLIVVEVVGVEATVREQREAAIPFHSLQGFLAEDGIHQVACPFRFLLLVLIFIHGAFYTQNGPRRGDVARVSVFKNKVIAARKQMLEGHARLCSREFTAESADVAEIVFV